MQCPLDLENIKCSLITLKWFLVSADTVKAESPQDGAGESFSHRARLALLAQAGTWGHTASLCPCHSTAGHRALGHTGVLRCPNMEQDTAVLVEVSPGGLWFG